MSREPERETRWSMVQRAAAGDGPARSALGRTYLPLVRAYLARRWRGTAFLAELEDALQDVFVECFRAEGALAKADPQRGDFRGFLFGVVSHVAQRHEARRRRGQERSEAHPSQIADNEASAARAFDQQWARMLMQEAGDRMRRGATDEAARRRVELLQLRFGDDLPIREIAQRWQMDATAVHRAYARAREEFRLCLRAVVAEHVVRTEQELDDECRRLFELLA